MAKKKLKIDRDDLHRISMTALRKEKKDQGAFDGRFATKSVTSKKKYKRKPKHPGKNL